MMDRRQAGRISPRQPAGSAPAPHHHRRQTQRPGDPTTSRHRETRMAVFEARRLGLTPFCVTIDRRPAPSLFPGPRRPRHPQTGETARAACRFTRNSRVNKPPGVLPFANPVPRWSVFRLGRSCNQPPHQHRSAAHPRPLFNGLAPEEIAKVARPADPPSTRRHPVSARTTRSGSTWWSMARSAGLHLAPGEREVVEIIGQSQASARYHVHGQPYIVFAQALTDSCTFPSRSSSTNSSATLSLPAR